MSTDATSAGKPVSPTEGEIKPTPVKVSNDDKGIETNKEEGDDEGEDEDEDDDDDDEDEDDEMDEDDYEDDDDEAEEDYLGEDPGETVSRRTRGIKVDYTSEEAQRRAGLDPGGDDEN